MGEHVDGKPSSEAYGIFISTTEQTEIIRINQITSITVLLSSTTHLRESSVTRPTKKKKETDVHHVLGQMG